MADDVQETTAQKDLDDSSPEDVSPGGGIMQDPATSDATKNTDTGQEDASTDEHMIPKSRFDEVNTELKQLREERQQAQREREEAERKAAEEQGKYQELYEQELAKREKAEAKARELEMNALRRKVANDVGLPDGLAGRLQGETESELKADAESLLETLPKPEPPNTNSGGGDGSVPANQQAVDALDGLTEDEFAARYNLNPETVKQIVNQQ